MIIKDGRTGEVAKVNTEHELSVVSKTLTHEGHQALLQGEVFLGGTPYLTATTTEGLMLYLKNDGTKTMVLTKLLFSWDGGSTNYNRPAFIRMSSGLTAPDTNITALTPGNTNLTSAIVSDVDGYYWDETGTGMTGFTEGGTIARLIIRQGLTEIECDGAFVIGPTDTLGIHVDGGEIGEFSCCIRYIESNFTELEE